MITDNQRLPAEVILESARRFKESIKGQRKCDFRDYERFKQILHSNSCWGYEKELADILEV